MGSYNRSRMAYKVPFDSTTLAAVTSDCQALIGGRLQKITQPEERTLILQVHGRGVNHHLILSCDPEFPRAHLTSVRPANPPEPPTFCMTARRWTENGFIESIIQLGFDRVLEIAVRGDGGRVFTYLVELMGKHSNIMLLDSSEEILAAAKIVGSKQSRRQVRPGLKYQPPPAPSGFNPLAMDVDEFEALVRDAEEVGPKWLVENVVGMSPFLAGQLWDRAGQSRPGLRAAYMEWRDTIANGRWEPVLFRDEQGLAVGAYPFPVAAPEPITAHRQASTSAALDAYYLAAIPRARATAIRTQLAAALGKARDSFQHAVDDLDRALGESALADRYQIFGDLILAYGHSLPPKSERLVAPDYSDPEQKPVEIPLDSELSAVENAESYFGRAKKAKGAAQSRTDRRAILLSDIADLESMIERMDQMDEHGLAEMRAVATRRGWLHRQEAVARDREDRPYQGFRIREVRTAEGFLILYGENATSNDHLTQKVARPNDLWLHVRGGTSAHAVIPTNNHPERVPPTVLQAAARLVARNSPAKHSSMVAVDYMLKKYVRKPRSAPPGAVTYSNEKTLHVNPTDP